MGRSGTWSRRLLRGTSTSTSGIAAGEELDEVPGSVTIHPANSKEPDPIMEMLRGKPGQGIG